MWEGEVWVLAYGDIEVEMQKQYDLKAAGRFAHVPSDKEMSDDVFLRIVVEEVGEVARALHEHDGSEAADIHLYKEITQIAAICAARMEGMRAQGRV